MPKLNFVCGENSSDALFYNNSLLVVTRPSGYDSLYYVSEYCEAFRKHVNQALPTITEEMIESNLSFYTKEFTNIFRTLITHPQLHFEFYHTIKHSFFKVSGDDKHYTWHVVAQNISELPKWKEKMLPSFLYRMLVPSKHTSFFTDSVDIHFLATIPLDNIDVDIVYGYKEQILQGENFVCIIYEHSFNNRRHSHYFIIDGHHKLMAYMLLNKRPPLIVCSSFGEIQNDEDKNRAKQIRELISV